MMVKDLQPSSNIRTAFSRCALPQFRFLRMAFRQTGNFPESKVTKLREIFDAFGSPGDAFTWRLRWRDGERCQCQSCQQVSTNAYNMPTICLQFSKVFSKVLLRRSMKPPSHLRSSTKQGQEQVISAQEADTSTSFCASAFFCEEVEILERYMIYHASGSLLSM